MSDATRRDYYEKSLASMRTERSTFDAPWRMCAEFVTPRRRRFYKTDRNKGDKRYK